MQRMFSLKKTSILITGVCGTVGKELLRQVLKAAPVRVVGVDNNESELFFLSEEYQKWNNVEFFVNDVRDRDTLLQKTRGIDVIFHAAALKHVGLCERSPQDAVMTNVLGVQNIIEAATLNNVKRVLFTSSDKAVNPTSVMGTSKLMGERLMTAADARRRGDGPIFVSTRFGNVLGSRGSVIPLFNRQIKSGEPVTLTDRRMTRFIMTLEEAVGLVLESCFLAHGGEVFITKMPVIRIEDLAHVMIAELAPRYGRKPETVRVKIVGARLGEKLYEELMNDEEIRRVVELDEYFVIRPAFKTGGPAEYRQLLRRAVKRAYNSANETPMKRSALAAYLKSHKVLEEAI